MIAQWSDPRQAQQASAGCSFPWLSFIHPKTEKISVIATPPPHQQHPQQQGAALSTVCQAGAQRVQLQV